MGGEKTEFYYETEKQIWIEVEGIGERVVGVPIYGVCLCIA